MKSKKMTVKRAKKLLSEVGLPTDIKIEIIKNEKEMNKSLEGKWHTPNHSGDYYLPTGQIIHYD